MLELSPSLQKEGRNIYLRFSRLNGLSFACLTESILILYALKTGVPSYLTGALAAFAYLSMPFMLLGKWLVGRVGAARTVTITWLMRNAVALVMITAPFAAGAGASPMAVTALIMVPSFVFFAFRSIGMVGFNPLIGEITTESGRGRFVSRSMMVAYVSYFIAVGLQIAAFSLHSGVATFQVIILCGGLMGVLAGMAIHKTPEGEVPRTSAREPVRETMRSLLANRQFRHLLWAQSSTLAIIVLVMPVSMIALKEGCGISDRLALVFAMIQIAGGITVSFFNGMVTDRTGPRPLMILYSAGLIGICILWQLAPLDFSWPFAAVTFFMIGCCMVGTVLSGNHYFLSITDARERLSGSLLSYAVPGLAAGVGGAVLTSCILKFLGNSVGLTGLALYKIYFAATAVLGGLLIIPVFRLERLEQWRVQQVLGLLFSPRDIWALFSLSRMEDADNLSQDKFHVKRLADSRSSLSEPALMEFSESPSLAIRWDALRGLRNLDSLHADAHRAVVSELENGVYTTAYIAAEIAGEQHIKSAIPALRQSLRVPDVFLRGKSMLALARLNDRESFDEIRRMFSQSDNPRILIHGAMAFVQFGDPMLIGDIYAKLLEADLVETVEKELLLNAAELGGVQDEFYQFTKLFNRDREAAISMLVETEGKATVENLRQNLAGVWQENHRVDDSFRENILRLFRSHPLKEIAGQILTAAQGRHLIPEAVACMVLIALRQPDTDSGGIGS